MIEKNLEQRGIKGSLDGYCIGNNQTLLRQTLVLLKDDDNVVEAVSLSSFVTKIQSIPLPIPQESATDESGS